MRDSRLNSSRLRRQKPGASARAEALMIQHEVIVGCGVSCQEL